MIEDAAVRSHLDEVIAQARTAGPLDPLCQLIDKVWQVNRGRQDPKLGDDAQLLGLQCHRNILNLAKPLIGAIDEVAIDGAQTLAIRFGGKVMHVSKVTSRDPLWSPYSISWDASEVRLRSARANTQAYSSSEDTLFASLTEGAFSPNAEPTVLRHLHLAWQGLEDAGTRVFVGFPQYGAAPWFAVQEIANGRPGTGGVPLPTDLTPTNSPDYDAMAEPKVAVKRRRSAGQEEAPHAGARS